MIADAVLNVRRLRASFGSGPSRVTVLDGVDFSIGRGETVGLIGESGCGKSVTALSIMGLLDDATISGEVEFEGRDLLALPERQWRRLRGNRIAMIFQEPMTSLNPVFTIGQQLDEPLLQHTDLSPRSRKARIVAALAETGMAMPELVYGEYPHRLSGGMRQRAMIALSMLGDPALLIADEPTTALDVTVQDQILSLLARLRSVRGMSLLLVTHDLGVVAQMCDRVAVMYAGQVVENADVATLFDNPKHPYTRALLASRIHLASRKQELRTIAGTVPTPGHVTAGCAFLSRCPLAVDRCATHSPPSFAVGDHVVRCWLHEDRPGAHDG